MIGGNNMKTTSGVANSSVQRHQQWQEEFGLKLRFPRPPEAQIKAILNNIQQPRIFLSEGDGNVDIVVRFSTSSRIFSPEAQESLESRGLTLSQAFESILWKKLDASGSSIWSEFVRVNSEAYRQAWLHFFELCYLEHFHPVANEWLKNIKEAIASPGNSARRGRRAKSNAENESLRTRYDALLPNCRLIHEAAENAISSLDAAAKNTSVREIRKAIWDDVWRTIHGVPGDGYIFGGAAFARIPYGEAKLHDPKSWKPHQLAIALLSFERKEAYQTIERKIKPTGKTKRSLSGSKRN
jgi:hypothetical protein